MVLGHMVSHKSKRQGQDDTLNEKATPSISEKNDHLAKVLEHLSQQIQLQRLADGTPARDHVLFVTLATSTGGLLNGYWWDLVGMNILNLYAQCVAPHWLKKELAEDSKSFKRRQMSVHVLFFRLSASSLPTCL